MRKSHAAAAIFFSATLLGAGITFADNPPANAPGEKPGTDLKETSEVQHLRDARKHLNEAKDAFEKDPKDTADHKKDAIEGIDKAIAAIDSEIDELKALK